MKNWKSTIVLALISINTYGQTTLLNAFHLNYIHKSNDSAILISKFIVSNASELEIKDTFLNNIRLKEIQIGTSFFHGQRTNGNKTYSLDWVKEEEQFELHVGYNSVDIPIYSFNKTELRHIQSKMLIWEEFSIQNELAFVTIYLANLRDTFPYYKNDDVKCFHFNLDSIFLQYENDVSAFKKIFELGSQIEITHRLNSFDIVVNSEIFAREKNKLLLEISNLNGKVYFSDVINFNQKYSLEIPQDEKLIVYKLSYDGILIEKKKYAR